MTTSPKANRRCHSSARNNNCPPQKKQRLRDIIEAGDRDAIGEVIALLQATDALPYSRAAAARLADEAMQALADFPDSAYKNALFSLAQHTTEREH